MSANPPASSSIANDDTKMTALRAAKKDLRSIMKPLLSSIPLSVLETQSTAATAALLAFGPYQRAQRLCIYLSMPAGEIQTAAIVRHALGARKAVFVPYLHKTADPAAPKRVMDMVRLRDEADFEGLARDRWGIPTIRDVGVGERESVLGSGEGLDLVVVPGVAFEVEEGVVLEGKGRGRVRRCGHGKGFYDFFLSRYMERFGSEDGVRLYGLALEEQVLRAEGEERRVPVGELDYYLHGLVMGDGQIISADSHMQ